MNKPEKIDAIYKEIANKELRENKIYNSITDWLDEHDVMFWYSDIWWLLRDNQWLMIGDVLDWLLENSLSEAFQSEVIINWEEFRKPIEEQSEWTISYIYDLIK